MEYINLDSKHNWSSNGPKHVSLMSLSPPSTMLSGLRSIVSTFSSMGPNANA